MLGVGGTPGPDGLLITPFFAFSQKHLVVKCPPPPPTTHTAENPNQGHIPFLPLSLHTSAFGKFPTHASEIKMKTTLEHTLLFDIADMKRKKRCLRVFKIT